MNRDLLKENRIHGSIAYPVGTYKMECKEYILDCHWHDEMEFLLVTGGKAIFQVGSQYYEVYEGQAIFVNCGELHAGYPLQNSPCKYAALVFNPDFLCSNEFDIIREKYILPIIERRLLVPTHIKGNNEWEKAFLLLLAQTIEQNKLIKQYTYEMTTRANILLLLSNILSNSTSVSKYKTPSVNNYKVERLKKVLNYIAENYREKITLPQLAAVLNMSSEHFCRYFKQMLKRSPIDYINYYRIKKSTHLLLNSTDKISSIATEVGFDNLCYFVSLFKHYMKCTPSMYRKQGRNSFEVSNI